jgi:hypothetical protein
MALLQPFVDVEKWMMALIDRDVPELNEKSGTEWPDDLATPFVRLERLPGRRNRLKDYPWVDVEVLAPGVQGKMLLEAIDTALFSYPGGVAVGDRFVKLEDISVITGPRRLPWDDDGVRRYAATYQLRLSRA